MSIKASDYRRAGRYAAQDKRRRATAREIEDAYEVLLQAIEAYQASADDKADGTFAAKRAAEDALYALDPKHSHFTS